MDSRHKEALRANLDSAIRGYLDYYFFRTYPNRLLKQSQQEEQTQQVLSKYNYSLDSVVDIIAGDL